MTSVDLLVLDASAYGHLRAGHAGVLDYVAEAVMVALPVTVLGELEAAFELGRRTRENRQTLSEFLDEPFVSVLGATAQTALHYARIFTALRWAGTPIPVNDVWIAAATEERRGSLLTFDRNYCRIATLDHILLDAS